MATDGRDMTGIVRPSVASDHFTLERWIPDPPLDRFIDRFWKTEWRLDRPFTQTIVTVPVVNLVVQADGSAMVSGVQRSSDERTIDGEGWALGAKFRVGGFRPFSPVPMATLVDEAVEASTLLGPQVDEIAERIVAAPDDAGRRQLFAELLGPLAPAERAVGEDIADLVDAAVAARPPITKVAELADRAGVSVRTLQRLFNEHVGVGPKVVLERFRVQAAGEAARAPDRSWPTLAADLGYADQAHLTADVSATFGAPPGAYARAEADGAGPGRGRGRNAQPVGSPEATASDA